MAPSFVGTAGASVPQLDAQQAPARELIGSGFALACIEPHDGVPRLELALYLSPGGAARPHHDGGHLR